MAVEPFGECALGPVRRIGLSRQPGVELELLDLGATTHALWVTRGDGTRRNVLLGHPTAQEQLDSGHFLGGTIGRYANRIAGGRFEIDGVAHRVTTNDRSNCLHGGPVGFDKQMWELVEATDRSATLRLVSPDGDQDFPGEVRAEVTFTVGDAVVDIELSATTDTPTPVSLTNHAYVDLAGEGSGAATEMVLQVAAAHVLGIDETGIPLPGPPLPVDGTPFDLRQGTRVGDLVRADHPQVWLVDGVDHCFVLEGTGLRRAATLTHEGTRTSYEIWTDQPGLQVYTGNALDGVPGSGGRPYDRWSGVALEPQLLPDAPNRPDFGEAVLRPGATFRSHTQWRLGMLS